MASYTSWLGLLANPHQLATLLLGIAATLLIVTMVPPSSVIYLIRADLRSHNGDVAWTSWFGDLGYCTADASNNALNTGLKCTGTIIGYDIKKAFEPAGAEIVPIPGVSAMSISMTKGSVVLNPVATILCLFSMVAFQAILRRPKGATYAVAMGSSLLALLVSGIAFSFEQSLLSLITSTYFATDAVFETSNGPLAYAMLCALVFQLAACVAGFYSCIGGKYDCEGGIRLGDKEVERPGVNTGRSSLDEKSPL
ncbi:hypothetical protein NUW58_g5850 [Xylaria curta]|uniref:Uncharacterized protein n=1 Tax=Xylaria curta TaxID=42375 RepID=A0ACC1P058_9PEZI|nr:hypothetical protein NUW58_g5850 [Xylaria curta]